MGIVCGGKCAVLKNTAQFPENAMWKFIFHIAFFFNHNSVLFESSGT
jgi:hypothetical protein